jgi:hypothetical protein
LQPAAPPALEMREVGGGGEEEGEVDLEGRRGRIGRVKEEEEGGWGGRVGCKRCGLWCVVEEEEEGGGGGRWISQVKGLG